MPDVAPEEIEQTATSDELAEKMESQILEVLGGQDKPDEELDEPAEKPEDEPGDEPADEPGDEPEEDESGEPDEDEDEKPEEPEPAVSDEDAPTVPAAWRRSLKAREWDDGEIDRFFKADPEIAIRTFERIHTSRVKEVSEFADLGRKAKAEAGKGEAKPDAEVEPHTSLQAIDEEALIGQYGNEDVVRAIAGPVNKVIQQLNAFLPDIQEGVRNVRQSRSDTLMTQVEAFFGQADLSPYREIYGDFKAGLSDGQREVRQKVLEEADALITGAALQGRSFTVADALTAAHDIVSASFKEKAIRSELKTKVKTRGKGLTLKPRGKSEKPGSGRPATRKDLERKVARGLAGVFS